MIDRYLINNIFLIRFFVFLLIVLLSFCTIRTNKISDKGDFNTNYIHFFAPFGLNYYELLQMGKINFSLKGGICKKGNWTIYKNITGVYIIQDSIIKLIPKKNNLKGIMNTSENITIHDLKTFDTIYFRIYRNGHIKKNFILSEDYRPCCVTCLGSYFDKQIYRIANREF